MKHGTRSYLGSLLTDAALSVRVGLSGMLGADEDAQALKRRVLALRRAYLDVDDASIASVLTSLAHSLYGGTRTDCLEADSLMSEAHRILKAGGFSIRAAKAAHLRGKINSRLHNLNVATLLHEEAEATYKRACPLSYVRAANLLCLAVVYRQTNRSEEAALKQQESDDIYQILLAASPRTIPG